MTTGSHSLGPLIPEALLIELRKRFPNRLPDIGMSDRELSALIGEQRVIAYLEREYQETHGGSPADDDF